MTRRLLAPWRRFESWLAEPEANAAGRLGLFRILFSLYYLWHLAILIPANLAAFPDSSCYPVWLTRLWPQTPGAATFEAMTLVLATALVWLMLGYRTRWATAVVLLVGAMLEAWSVTVDFERSTVLLTAFIPLFMLVAGDWGATYSLDAARRRARGLEAVDPADGSARYSLPIRAVLVVLVFLFVTSGVHKALPSSPWLTQDNVFGYLFLTRRIEAAYNGLTLIPFGPLFLSHGVLDGLMRLYVVLFEAGFVLALFSRRLRALFLSQALIFHVINAAWLAVTFTPIIVVYGLFVDWEALRRRLVPGRPATPAVSPWACAAATLAAAAGSAALWGWTDAPRRVLTLGGLLTPVSIWYPVLPFAAAWFAVTGIGLARDVLNRRRPRGTMPAPT